MNSFLEWLMNTAQIGADKLYGIAALLLVLILVLGIGVLRHKAAFLIGCIVRLVSGGVTIFLVNAILSYYHVEVPRNSGGLSALCSFISVIFCAPFTKK